MSLWEKIKSIFSKNKTPMLEEGEDNSRKTYVNDGRDEFVNGVRKLEYSPEQLKEQARTRQFCIARDAIDAMQTRWNRENITTKEGIEILLNSRGYGQEEIALDKLEIDILNQMGTQAKFGNIPKETLEYFGREDMEQLVGKIKEKAIEEAGKFQYTKEAANRFIPNIPETMNTIKEQEMAEQELEQEK